MFCTFSYNLFFTKRIETFPLTTYFYTCHAAYCTYSYKLLPINCLTRCHSESVFSSFSQNCHLQPFFAEVSTCVARALLWRIGESSLEMCLSLRQTKPFPQWTDTCLKLCYKKSETYTRYSSV